MYLNTMTKTMLTGMGSMALCLGAAHAEALQNDAASWRFQATPYVWMTGLSGNLQVSPHIPTAHFSQSFSEVFDNLNAAAFLNGTARKGRYVLHADASYASVSDTAGLPLGLQAQAKLRQSSVTLSAGYNWQLSPSDSLDVMAGIRWWNLRASVQVAPLLQAQTKQNFVDPIVALRWHHQINPQWSSLLYTDVGGFSVGSRLTWQALAVLNYQVKDNFYLSAGYRQLNVDRRSHGQRLDFSLSGPILGATLRF